MAEPMVGDTVLIRGTVVQVSPGVGVLVELFSKTDQYQAWVREDLVEQVVIREVPPEPPNGTWLQGKENPDTGQPSVFHRNDANAGVRPGRRFVERWWDFAASEWVDWPEAFRRGADPTAVLLPDGARHIGRHEIEPGGYCRKCGTHHSPEEIARIEDRVAEERGSDA